MSGWPPTSARRMRSIAFGGAATTGFISRILTREDEIAPAVTIAAHGKFRTPEAGPLAGLERVAGTQHRSHPGSDERGPVRQGHFRKGPAARGHDARQSFRRHDGRNRL